jgi:hypothetical protein
MRCRHMTKVASMESPIGLFAVHFSQVNWISVGSLKRTCMIIPEGFAWHTGQRNIQSGRSSSTLCTSRLSSPQSLQTSLKCVCGPRIATRWMCIPPHFGHTKGLGGGSISVSHPVDRSVAFLLPAADSPSWDRPASWSPAGSKAVCTVDTWQCSQGVSGHSCGNVPCSCQSPMYLVLLPINIPPRHVMGTRGHSVDVLTESCGWERGLH